MKSKVLRRMKKQNQNRSQKSNVSIAYKIENIYHYNKDDGTYRKDPEYYMLYWQEKTIHTNLGLGVWECYGIFFKDDLRHKVGQKQWNRFLGGKKVFILPMRGLQD